MVAFNFQAQFADMVETGFKTSTIRKPRYDLNLEGIPVKTGQQLQLYTGMRTKACRKLKDATATGCDLIWLKTTNGTLKVAWGHTDQLSNSDLTRLAFMEGFTTTGAMAEWFMANHDPVVWMRLFLIQWGNTPLLPPKAVQS